jgi:exopolyphosphatase / guanosine-5'-triphosphate,3'-diphosphate pyrophosphatase
MKIKASLDIGSNSILLLVAKVTKDKRIFPLLEMSRIPRLAQNLKQTGRISDQSLERAIRDINYLKSIAYEYGVDEIHAVATQAIRTAKNKGDLVDRIKKQTGTKVVVISGKREAELTYLGAITGLGVIRKNRILLDIGGASSEFVWAEGNEILKAVSLKIGAVEITEKYRTDLKRTPEELDNISHELDLYFMSKLKLEDFSGFELIGSGGTISTFKMLDIGQKQYLPEEIHGTSLKSQRLDELLYNMANMKLSDRKRFIIFEPRRAEVIVAGGLIMKSLLKHFWRRVIRISTRSLRWGFLKSKL